MLNLQDDRSVVKSLLEAGNDVYMIDWGYPTAEDKFMTMDDHINWYMDECVEYIRKATGAKKVNLMGICQGGTFSTIYTACHQEKVNSLITLVTPIDFETNDGLLFKWGKDLKIDSMIDHYGVVPADVMNFSYLILKPLTLSFDKYVKMVPKMHDRKFLENYMRMERWTFDSPDQEGETLRQFIKDLYQGNKLVKGELVVGDYTVNLKNITCPVLMACGDADHLVPLAASEKFVEYVGSDDATYMHFKTGHIGMFTSSRSQKEIIPNITEWLAKRA
jgi:polyhydroxyalkanoate synthase